MVVGRELRKSDIQIIMEHTAIVCRSKELVTGYMLPETFLQYLCCNSDLLHPAHVFFFNTSF